MSLPEKVLVAHTVLALVVVAHDVSAGTLPLRALVTLLLTCIGYVVLFVALRRDSKARAAKSALAQAAPANHFFITIADVRQNRDGITEYKMEGSYKGQNWVAWRRFSEIRQLKRRCPPNVAQRFPGKSSFTQIISGSDHAFSFIDERRRALNAFLKEAVKDEAAFELLADVPVTRHALGLPDTMKVSAASSLTQEQALKEGMKAIDMTVELAKHSLTKDGGDGWKFHSSSNDGISCFVKQDGDFTYAMGRGPMDPSPQKCAEFLMNLEHRSAWDELWKSTTELELFKKYDGTPLAQTMNDDYEVLTLGVSLTCFSSPAKALVAERDSVAVFICVKRKLDGAYIIALRSVEHAKAPEGLDGYIRAKISVAGFLLEPRGQACTLTTMGLVDPNGKIPKFIISAVAPQRAYAIRDINSAMKKLGFA